MSGIYEVNGINKQITDSLETLEIKAAKTEKPVVIDGPELGVGDKTEIGQTTKNVAVKEVSENLTVTYKSVLAELNRKGEVRSVSAQEIVAASKNNYDITKAPYKEIFEQLDKYAKDIDTRIDALVNQNKAADIRSEFKRMKKNAQKDSTINQELYDWVISNKELQYVNKVSMERDKYAETQGESLNFHDKIENMRAWSNDYVHGTDSAYHKAAFNEYKMMMEMRMEDEFWTILNSDPTKEWTKADIIAKHQERIKEQNPNADVKDPDFERFVDKSKAARGYAATKQAVMQKRSEVESITADEIREQIKKEPVNLLKRSDYDKFLGWNKVKSNLADKLINYLESAPVKDKDGNPVMKDGKPVLKYKNEDGTYNLRILSEEIYTCTGSDYFLNASQNEKESELYNFRTWIADCLGAKNADDITANDARILLQYFKYDIEGKDRSVRFFDGIAGLVENVATATTVLETCVTPLVITLTQDIKIEQTQQVLFNITSGLNLPQAQQQGLVNALIDVFQHQEVSGTEVYNVLSRYAADFGLAMAEGALIALASEIIRDVLIGHQVPFEKNCFSTSILSRPEFISLARFKQHMNTYRGQEYERIKSTFDKHDKLDTLRLSGYLRMQNNKGQISQEEYNKVVEYLDKHPDVSRAVLDKEFPEMVQKSFSIFYATYGDWDKEGFREEWDRYGGLGSNDNCQEGPEKLKDAPTGKKEVIMADEVVVQTKTEVIHEPEKVEYEDQQDCQTFFEGEEVGLIFWPDLIKWWDGQSEGPSLRDKYELRDAITILKMVQCLDKDHKDYSPEFLEELLRLSKTKNCAGLKTVEGFNYEHYMELRNGKMPQNLNMPMELAGVKRSCDKTAKDLVHTTPITQKGNNGKSKYKAQVGEKRIPGGTKTRTVVTGLEQRYHATEKGSGKDNVFNDKTGRDLWTKPYQKEGATITDHGKDKKKYDEESKPE